MARLNDFKLDAGPESGLFADSPEAKALDFKKNCFTGGFFKVIQSKLALAVWEFFADKQSGESKIVINIQGKKPEAFVNLPMPEPHELKLYFVGNVSQIKSNKALPFVTVFGVPFFIEARLDAQHVDMFIPAWTVKSVSKVDQAFFHQKDEKLKLLLMMPPGSSSPTELQVMLTTSEIAENKNKSETGKNFIADATLTVLAPLADVNKKVEEDFQLQKQRAEKTARTMVDAALKKAQKSGAGSAKAKAALAGMNIELPEDQAARVAALEELIKDCEKLDAVVAKAVEQVKKPTRVPITKLQEERGGIRTKIMKDALIAAKADSGTTSSATKDDENDPSLSSALIGVQALMNAAEKGGDLKRKKKAKGSGSDAKSSAAADIKKLGKHLLK